MLTICLGTLLQKLNTAEFDEFPHILSPPSSLSLYSMWSLYSFNWCKSHFSKKWTFVVIHSAGFLIQSNKGGTNFMEMTCKRKYTKECNCTCTCYSNKRGRIRKSPRHLRTKKTQIKKLIFIHRCVPINQKCDDTTTQTYFCVSSDSNIKKPSGTISIINTSKSCTMQVTISKSSCDHEVIDIAPNSSFTAIVTNLKFIKILCKSQSNNDLYCTGSMELDIHYILMF